MPDALRIILPSCICILTRIQAQSEKKSSPHPGEGPLGHLSQFTLSPHIGIPARPPIHCHPSSPHTAPAFQNKKAIVTRSQLILQPLPKIWDPRVGDRGHKQKCHSLSLVSGIHGPGGSSPGCNLCVFLRSPEFILRFPSDHSAPLASLSDSGVVCEFPILSLPLPCPPTPCQ
jgi:hypothetical protein